MFERFTDKARRTIVIAQEEARVLHFDHIHIGHILLGITHDADLGSEKCAAATVLEEFGYTYGSIRGEVGTGIAEPKGHIPFTDESKRTLELALREALALGYNYISRDHLALGVLRHAREFPQGSAADILGDDEEAIRERLVQCMIKPHEAPVEEGGVPPFNVPPELPMSDYEAIASMRTVLDQLDRQQRKAIMAYLRERYMDNE